MVHGIIYAIIDDGYFYIGSTTKSIEERINKHISESRTKKIKLYDYINKVRKGWEDIIYIILEEVECTEKELHNKEYQYIKTNYNNFSLNKIKDDKQGCIIRNYINKRKNIY